MVTSASILFELMQWRYSNIFDYKDILASFIGGSSAIYILNLVIKHLKN